MKVRMRDIASRAGVSPATVSNAMNGRPGVSREVTKQIFAIARELGYEPSKPHAEADRGHIRLIVYRAHGLVVMDTPFFAELIESIQRECQKAGLELMVSHVHASDGEKCMAQIREYCASECAGILLLATEMDARTLSRFRPCASPLVVLDNLFERENAHCVVMNNFDAGFIAANELAACGHRRIGHITSSVDFSNMRGRRRGFEAAMAENGLPVSEESFWPVTPTVDGAYRDMKVFLDAGRALPTAFFAGNDIMAVGCMRALAEAGARVPEDVSVIGMDDTSLCLACAPLLTTMRVFRREMGAAAVYTLLSLAREVAGCAIKTEIGVELIRRDSVRNLN